jgi:hypothetical protein
MATAAVAVPVDLVAEPHEHLVSCYVEIKGETLNLKVHNIWLL